MGNDAGTGPKGLRLVVLLLPFFAPAFANAQDPDQAFDFWLSKTFLHSLAENRGLFYSMHLNMERRTNKVGRRPGPQAGTSSRSKVAGRAGTS